MSKIAQKRIWVSGWFNEVGMGTNFCSIKMDGIGMSFMMVHDDPPKLKISKNLDNFEIISTSKTLFWTFQQLLVVYRGLIPLKKVGEVKGTFAKYQGFVVVNPWRFISVPASEHSCLEFMECR